MNVFDKIAFRVYDLHLFKGMEKAEAERQATAEHAQGCARLRGMVSVMIVASAS
jgi:hypothetical protein